MIAHHARSSKATLLHLPTLVSSQSARGIASTSVRKRGMSGCAPCANAAAAYNAARAEFLDHLDLGHLNGAELDALAKALNANEPDEEEIEFDENGEEEDDEAVPSPPSFMFSRPEQAKARRAAINRDAERRQAMYRQMAGAAEDEDTVPPAPKWMTKKD